MTVRIPLETLRAFAREALHRSGLGEQDAATAAEVVVYADEHGFTTHGSNALAGIYSPRLLDGRINPAAQPRTVHESASSAVLDGDGGLGLVTTSSPPTSRSPRPGRPASPWSPSATAATSGARATTRTAPPRPA
ncbi:hypothetical protein GCM10025734_28170 [Kitasatospora paranensis]|uniref:Ldh family oxidoreductase n=1 Tax=Kitasatospora paranensis TaxID=258053 RepID=UPI0031E5EFD4